MSFLPSLTLWTLDGPPEDSRDQHSSPSRSKLPDYTEATQRDSDEEGSYATPPSEKGDRWAWDHTPSSALRKVTPPAATSSDNIAQRILAGEHHMATFSGTSQYARGGSSACGLASMNAVRLAFDFCSTINDGEALISKLMSEEYAKDSMAIANSWPDEMHLEVEPIVELPIFARSLRVTDVRYQEARYRTFSDALIHLQSDVDPLGPRAFLLTRPPEMIAIIHIPIALASTTGAKSVFLVFDSHPRPNHPDGAAVQFFPSDPTDDVADYLTDLFQVDDSLINDPTLEWHAQLLGQVSCHFLAPVIAHEAQDEYAMSMALLSLKQRLTQAERKLEAEATEKRQLRSRIFDLQQEVAWLNNTERRKQDEITRLKAELNSNARQHQIKQSSWTWNRDIDKKNAKGKGREGRRDQFDRAEFNGGGTGDYSSPVNGHQWPRPRSPPLPKNPPKTPPKKSYTMPPPLNATPGPSNSWNAPKDTQDEDMMRSLEMAMAMQRAFDEERMVALEDESLARAAERPKFDCAICMESFTDEAIAPVDPCDHSCCRDCMRTHVQSKIEERRYPIPCPFCVASSDKNVQPKAGSGFIPSILVETIGITPELYLVFSELQMAEHSIMIDCRKCSKSAFVDRKDYDLVEIITCPLPGCNNSWCKQCNQTIQGGARHSCDGSAELETLMNQRGWKHCPGCRTPIERSVGCNHMTCSTPGCNMHFCYICGAVVIRGGTRHEIQNAVSTHFRSCRLFEVPREG